MTKRMKGTTSPMNTGAFKRVFSVLVVLLIAATLMVGAGSATEVSVSTWADLKDNLTKTDVTKITLANDIVVDAQVNITHSLVLEGNGKTISANTSETVTWGNGDGDKHLLQISNSSKSAEVTIQNLKLDGKNKAGDLHVYDTGSDKQIILNSVSINGSDMMGLHVNGANVSATGLKIENSAWGISIDIDSGYNVQNASVLRIDNLNQLSDLMKISQENFNTEAKVYINGVETANGYVLYHEKSSSYGKQRLVWAAEDYVSNTPLNVSVQNTTTDAVDLHASLTRALSDYVADGATVTLLKDLDAQTEMIGISKNITFDGADKQITFSTTPTGGAIQITATGDVTLQNLNITSTGGSETALIRAVVTGEGDDASAPNKVVITGSKLKVTEATSGYAVIHAQPMSALEVKNSEISAETVTVGTHVYGILFNPDTEVTKSLDVSEGNKIVLKTEEAAYGVYIAGNTTGLTTTISGNTLSATSDFRAALVYYTPKASNVQTTIEDNTLILSGEQVYVQNIMESHDSTGDLTININMNGNTVENLNTTGSLYAIGFAQRADMATAEWKALLVGTISSDNKFTTLTGYVNHITDNVQDGKTIIQLDTSKLIIEGQTIDLKIVAPHGTSIDKTNTSQTEGQSFSVTPVGTVVSWTSDNTSVLKVAADGAYSVEGTGTATITAVGPGGAEATMLITVYKPVAPELPVESITTSTAGTTTVETYTTNTGNVESDGSTYVTITDPNTGVEMKIEGTVVATADGYQISNSEITLTYPAETSAVSPEVAEDKAAEGTYKTEVVVNLANGTTLLLNTTPVFNESVIDIIKAKQDVGKYKFISMFSATGENVTRINANLTETGGVEITFTVPLNWVKTITHNDLTKLKAFHVSNGKVEILSGSGVVDGGSYKFTVIGNSFSSYVLAADTTAPQNNDGNGGNGGGSSSSGSSTWLPSEPTQQPTQTPTEEQPTDKPTDTVPTDIPSSQPTATPSTPGFGVLAVLAGLGAVAVLRRQ